MLIHNKDDIEFVTEFPCFFGTPCTNKLRFVLFKKEKGKIFVDFKIVVLWNENQTIVKNYIDNVIHETRIDNWT